MPSTEELVITAASGETAAFAELVRRYEGTVLVTAWSIVGDFHAAQDVAQDAFVIAYRKLTKLQKAQAFGPWLLSIVKREALRTKRKRLDRSEVPVPDNVLADSEVWWQEYQRLLPTLDNLPEQERLVVSLRYIDGLSVREIAETTKRPIGTVTKQLSRGVKRLRSFILEAKQ